MPRTILRALLALAVLLPASGRSASAQLTVGDFLTAGDRLLVDDHATGMQWLTPVYTRGLGYNGAFVQSLIGTHGFRYATGDEVRSLITTNFGNPTSGWPGDAAGFASAQQFLDTFGVASHITCFLDLDMQFPVACPRTQGFTSTPGAVAGTRLAFGMIQFGDEGAAIYDNPWSETASDPQVGSWLVRAPATTTAPEPATWVLLGAGLVALGGLQVRRTRAA